jgi:hypothetical protein
VVGPPYTVALTSPSVCTISGVRSETQIFSGRTAMVTCSPSRQPSSRPVRKRMSPARTRPSSRYSPVIRFAVPMKPATNAVAGRS